MRKGIFFAAIGVMCVQGWLGAQDRTTRDEAASERLVREIKLPAAFQQEYNRDNGRDFDFTTPYNPAGFIEIEPVFNSWNTDEIAPFFYPEEAPGKISISTPESETDNNEPAPIVDVRALGARDTINIQAPGLNAWRGSDQQMFMSLDDLAFDAEARSVTPVRPRGDPQQQVRNPLVIVTNDIEPLDAKTRREESRRRERELSATESTAVRRINLEGKGERARPEVVLRPESEYYVGLRVQESFMFGNFQLIEQTGWAYSQEKISELMFGASVFAGTTLNAIVPGLRAEVEYTYNMPIKMVHNEFLDKDLLSIKADTVMVALYWDLSVGQRFSFYVGGGGGVAIYQTNDFAFNEFTVSIGPAFMVAGGSRIRISSSLAGDIGVRFVSYGLSQRDYTPDYALGWTYTPMSANVYAGLIYGF